MTAAVKGAEAGPVPAVRPGDVLITLVLLVTFASAYVAAQPWPFEAKLFPQMLSVAGTGFAAVKLVALGLQLHRRRRWLRRAGPGGAAAGGNVDRAADHDDRMHSPEYVFGTAGRRAWAAAVAWVAAFFVALWMLGVYVTVPLFAVVYLRFAGRHSWPATALYAAVAGGLLWSVFSYMLEVPMPAGIF
jgi:Tripartite tricarboxylate transporter TctB family